MEEVSSHHLLVYVRVLPKISLIIQLHTSNICQPLNCRVIRVLDESKPLITEINYGKTIRNTVYYSSTKL